MFCSSFEDFRRIANPVIRRSKLNYFLEAGPMSYGTTFATTVHSRSELIYCRGESIVLLPGDAIAERAGETPPKTRNFLSFDSVAH